MSLPDLEAPPYGAGTLAEVLPSAAALLGVEWFRDVLSLAGDGGSQRVDAVTVLLVDGLGWEAWRRHAEVTPHLRDMDGRMLSTTVPSTTPTALASLGTGMPPGTHGIVGASFRLPDDGEVLHPLSWQEGPHPRAVQPEATVFERVAAAGIPVATVASGDYADSGLTQAVLRGGRYVPVADTADMVAAVTAQDRGLTYAYVADLDRTGHVHGVHSEAWRDALVEVDGLVGRLLDHVGPGRRLIVTADHGMVDCPPEDKVAIESLPGFVDVTLVAGEPRMRHVYAQPGACDDLAQRWQETLRDRAWVTTRESALASGILGATDPDYVDRIGDIVIMARGSLALTSTTDTFVSGLMGQHGSITPDEVRIPLLLA